MIAPGVMVAVTLASSAPPASLPSGPTVTSGEESADANSPFATYLRSAVTSDGASSIGEDETLALDLPHGDSAESVADPGLAPLDRAADDDRLAVPGLADAPDALDALSGVESFDEGDVVFAPVAFLQVAQPLQDAQEVPSPVLMDRAILSSLSRDFASKLTRVADRMWTEHGMSVQLIEGYRTQARQDQLFAQGRTEPGPIVTWTRSSLHSTGQAADLFIDGAPVTPEAAVLLAQVARQEGLETLYPYDSGHIQIDRGGGVWGPEGPLPRSIPGTPIEPSTETTPQRGVAPVAQVAPVARPARSGGPGGNEPLDMAHVGPGPNAPADLDLTLRSATVDAVASTAGSAVSGGRDTSPRRTLAPAPATPQSVGAAEIDSSRESQSSDAEPPGEGKQGRDDFASDLSRGRLTASLAGVADLVERVTAEGSRSGGSVGGQRSAGVSTHAVSVEGGPNTPQPLPASEPMRVNAPTIRAVETVADPWSGTVERVAEVMAMRADGSGPVTHRVRIPIVGLGSAASVHLTVRGELVDAEVRVADTELAGRLSTRLGELRTRLTTVGVEARDVTVRLAADPSDVLVRSTEAGQVRTQTASRDGTSLGNPSHRSGREADPDQQPRREPTADDEEQPR